MSITDGNLHGIRFQDATIADDGVRHLGGSSDAGAAASGGKEGTEVAFAGSCEARGGMEEERLGEEEVRGLGMALQCGEAMEGAARTC